jgi:hypothetical protein
MFMKFKLNREPCTVYELIEGTPTPEWDEIGQKYGMCIKVAVIGYVGVEYLVEAKDHPRNVKAADMLVYLSNLEDEQI